MVPYMRCQQGPPSRIIQPCTHLCLLSLRDKFIDVPFYTTDSRATQQAVDLYILMQFPVFKWITLLYSIYAPNTCLWRTLSLKPRLLGNTVLESIYISVTWHCHEHMTLSWHMNPNPNHNLSCQKWMTLTKRSVMS